MKELLNTKRKYGYFFQNQKNILIITDDVNEIAFKACMLDVIVVKKEHWESNNELRDCLIPCLTEESHLILI